MPMVDKKIDIVNLKYCPRTKHSPDLPLKKPTRTCFNRSNDGRCGFLPCVNRYCDKNNVKFSLGTQFICVNPNNVVGRKPKRATIELEGGYKFRLECPVFDDSLQGCSDRLEVECIAMYLKGICPELKIYNMRGIDMTYNAPMLAADIASGGLRKQWPSVRGE